jgi:hypothetical protein
MWFAPFVSIFIAILIILIIQMKVTTAYALKKAGDDLSLLDLIFTVDFNNRSGQKSPSTSYRVQDTLPVNQGFPSYLSRSMDIYLTLYVVTNVAARPGYGQIL